MDAVYTESIASDGEDYWYTSWDDNGIYKTNIKAGKTECAARFTEEPMRKLLYGSNVLYGNRLVAVPRLAQKIGIYDIIKKECQYVPFQLPEEKYWQWGHFSAYVVYKNYIYMLGIRCPIILRLDMDTYVVKYYGDWYAGLKPYIDSPTAHPLFFGGDPYIEDTKFYAPVGCASFVLCFDMEQERVQLIPVKKERGGYDTLCFDGRDFWLASGEDRAVLKWNRESGSTEEYRSFPEAFSMKRPLFTKSFYCHGKVWLTSRFANIILQIDPDTGKMEEVLIPGTEYLKSTSFRPTYVEPVGNESVRTIDRIGKCWHELNLKTGQVSHYRYAVKTFAESFVLESDSDKQWFVKRGGAYVEGGGKYLDGFLEYVRNVPEGMNQLQVSCAHEMLAHGDDTCGEKVLRAVRKELV